MSVVAELRDMALALGEEEAAQQASSSSSSSSIASASSASTAAAGAPHAPALAEGKTRKSSKTLLVRAPPTVASLNVLADKVAKIAAQLAEPGAGRVRPVCLCSCLSTLTIWFLLLSTEAAQYGALPWM